MRIVVRLFCELVLPVSTSHFCKLPFKPYQLTCHRPCNSAHEPKTPLSVKLWTCLTSHSEVQTARWTLSKTQCGWIPEQRCCWASGDRSPAAPSCWWGLCSSGPADCDTAWSAPGKTWAWCSCSAAHWLGTPSTFDWHSCGHKPWIYWSTPSLGAAGMKSPTTV